MAKFQKLPQYLLIQEIFHSQNIDIIRLPAVRKEKFTKAKTWVEKSNINQPWVEKGG